MPPDSVRHSLPSITTVRSAPSFEVRAQFALQMLLTHPQRNRSMTYIDRSNARRAMTLLAFAASALWLELRLDWAVRRFRHSRGRWQRLRAFNALRDLIYLREQAQNARERVRRSCLPIITVSDPLLFELRAQLATGAGHTSTEGPTHRMH
jgi:pimeloyl-ACP methyl ester carboxylesterase